MMNRAGTAVCVVVAMAIAEPVTAQTPYTIERTAEAPASGGAKAAGASAANAWLGAQLGYKFGSNSDDLGDNLLVSASVIYNIPLAATRRFKLPVISNFADLIASPVGDTAAEVSEDKLTTLLFATSGIRAGVYPYGKIPSWSGNDFDFLVHGEASWKLNGFKQEDSQDVNYLNQFRLAGGFELAIGDVSSGGKPLTVSVTPVLTAFDEKEYEKAFGDSKRSMRTLEIVAVLPVSARTGVLFEYVRGGVSSFRAGVIIAGDK